MTEVGFSAAAVTGFAPRMGEAGSRAATGGPDQGTNFADLLRDLAAPAAQATSPQLAERRTAWPDDLAPDPGAADREEDAGATPDAAASLDADTSTGEATAEVLGQPSPALLGLPGSAALAVSAGPMLPAGPQSPDLRRLPEAPPAPAGAIAAAASAASTACQSSQESVPLPRALAGAAIAGNDSRAPAMPPGRVEAAHISERAAADGSVVMLGRETYIAQLRSTAPAPMPAQRQAPAADPSLPRADALSTAAEGAIAPPREHGQAENGDGSGKDGAEPRPSPAGPEDAAVSTTATESQRAAGTPSPTQQVAGRIVAAALAAHPEHLPAGAAPAIAGAMSKEVSTPVVKVLRLQLQPADLGTITIRLSLREDALDIRLEASRHGTAGMLQRDQETLARLLSSAGYRLDGMAVTVTAADGTQLADARAAVAQTATAPDSWGSTHSDARSSGGRHNAPADPGPSRGKQHEDDDKSGALRSAVGGLYV